MKYIVVDKNMPEDFIKKLKRFPYKIVKTKENFNLPQGISAHPDILVHSFPNGDIVVDRDNFSYYENIFKGRKVFKTENSLAYDYKSHVSLNGFFYKGYFIGNLKYIDSAVLKYYKDNYKLIDIKQGYSKCNTLITDKFLATSDLGIYKALKDKFNIIKIKHKGINLRGYEYGFIGGTCGFIDNTLILCGSLKKHRSGETIREKCRENEIEILELADEKLEDFGSILLI